MGKLQVVRAEGPPARRGMTIGRALGEQIGRAGAFCRRFVARRGLSPSDLERLLAPYLEAADRALPHLVAQLRGIADGARVPFTDVLCAAAFEEVYSVLDQDRASPDHAASSVAVSGADHPRSTRMERCSDFVIRGPGTTILAHNEQWYPDDSTVPVVVDVSDDPDETTIVGPFVAGTLPVVGMNAHGSAVGVMSLAARDERAGIPRVLVARDALEAADHADAVGRVTRPGRAGGYTYLYALTGGDSFTIETSATRHAVLDDLVHTNHALSPEVGAVAYEASASSRSRHVRLQALIEQRAPQTVEDAMAILGDHGAGSVEGICGHPDPADGDEGTAILFGMVCDVEAGRMWIAPGQPCSTPFEELKLADLF